jgi:tetratricopeptide (TPR) repeat protein
VWYGGRSWDERVVRDKPAYRRATILYTLTRAHLESDPRISLEYYREAYAIGEQSKEVTEQLVGALMTEKRYVEASDVIRQYQMDHPGDTDLGNMLRIADEAQRVIDRERLHNAPPSSLTANTLVQRAQQLVRLAPNDPWTYSNLADAEIRAILEKAEAQTDDNFALAALHARQAVLLEPRKPEYLGQLGAILTFAKRYQAADSAFAEALAMDPGFFATHPLYQNAQRYARAVSAGLTPPRVEPFGLYSPAPRP